MLTKNDLNMQNNSFRKRYFLFDVTPIFSNIFRPPSHIR